MNMQHPIYPSPAAAPRRRPRHPMPPVVVALLVAGGLVVGFLVVMLLVVAMLIGGIYASDKILPNVTIDDSGIKPVAVGSMPVDEAATRLQDVAVDRTISLHDGSRTWELPAVDLGISVDAAASADKASQAGREDGSIFTGINTMLRGAAVSPVYTIDLAKAQSALSALSDKTNIEPGAGGDVTV